MHVPDETHKVQTLRIVVRFDLQLSMFTFLWLQTWHASLFCFHLIFARPMSDGWADTAQYALRAPSLILINLAKWVTNPDVGQTLGRTARCWRQVKMKCCVVLWRFITTRSFSAKTKFCQEFTDVFLFYVHFILRATRNCWAFSKCNNRYQFFKVFGLTRLRIESRIPASKANALNHKANGVKYVLL